MEANAGESFQMQILSNIFPRISLHCKLVPVQYREYEYGLLTMTWMSKIKDVRCKLAGAPSSATSRFPFSCEVKIILNEA